MSVECSGSHRSGRAWQLALTSQLTRAILPAVKPPRSRDAPQFPIVEVFGYNVAAATAGAKMAAAERSCPFAGNACEKFQQYKYGYCSVGYAAQDDNGERSTYAVCDHRLDGAPVSRAVIDHFGSNPNVRLVPEIVLTRPRTSFDYAAFTETNGAIGDVIAIETQAIDIRGGGVGPAWRAWEEGKPDEWRRYFTSEARQKGRKDTVAYGVNMANIYKRLGLQVAEKGAFLKRIGVPFYVVMQDRPFKYLRSRIPFEEVSRGGDITFMTSDYTGRTNRDGTMEFTHRQTVRTSLSNYVTAMNKGSRAESSDRAHFLERIKGKANLGK